MNLTDAGILELNELCNAVVDGTITARQKARLAQWLLDSEAARRYYVRALGLSASLHTYAAEMQSDAADALPANVLRLPSWRWWTAIAAAAAAVIVLLVRLSGSRQDVANANSKTDESVARLTGSKSCQWAGDSAPLRASGRYFAGEKLELATGFAEITFDSGAQVVLEGRSSFIINSAWGATLNRGALKATIPHEAMYFSISNSAVQVVDLGTEFSMIANSNSADVMVLKGEVEADPNSTGDQPKIFLHEKQARRFADSGVSTVTDSAEMFARFTQPVKLDHPSVRDTVYVHWSFDEPTGESLAPDSFGAPSVGHEVRLYGSQTTLDTAHTEGRWQNALHFNGKLFAKAAFPGLSESSTNTVLFWVKIPEDAQVSDAYAMVGWATKDKKIGSHPVHISWNRNPAEGPVGVLRTDYGGGFALGKAPLRDGRWHHVAVVFAPGDDPAAPVEVKQYVDGHFEGEGNPSPLGRSEDPNKFNAANAASVRDIVWLGCRLGNNGERLDRFRGDMDELTIADRALTPQEIVQLMKYNQPPQPALTMALQ